MAGFDSAAAAVSVEEAAAAEELAFDATAAAAEVEALAAVAPLTPVDLDAAAAAGCDD